MQESSEQQKASSRQEEMLFLYNEIGGYVAQLCDVRQQDIYSKSKIAPLPICRGICWYAIRVAFNATYGEISELTRKARCHYTSAGISFSVNQAISLASKNPNWSNVWNKVKNRLPNRFNNKDKDKDIVIQIIIPKGSKDNIKFEIKEKN